MTSRRIIFLYLILTLIACIAFRDVRTFEFVNYDDNVYVTKNPHVCGGDFFDNVIWAFTSIDTGNWHPLTWVSHIVDCKVYGFDSTGHHLTSVLFHILTGLLIFHVFRLITMASYWLLMSFNGFLMFDNDFNGFLMSLMSL